MAGLPVDLQVGFIGGNLNLPFRLVEPGVSFFKVACKNEKTPLPGLLGTREKRDGVANGIRTRNSQNHNLGLYH